MPVGTIILLFIMLLVFQIPAVLGANETETDKAENDT